jgi:hypothetical protein
LIGTVVLLDDVKERHVFHLTEQPVVIRGVIVGAVVGAAATRAGPFMPSGKSIMLPRS